MPDAILDQLVSLSHELGREERRLTILGEGNTSADNGDGSFWVKGSGSQLGTIKPEQFSRARTDRVLALLEQTNLDGDELDAALRDALADASHAKPSIGAEPFRGHIFPDAIVVCGRHPMIVPYVDPGLPIAAAFDESLGEYLSRHGKPPKLALLVNHGIVALGQSAREVINITLMAEKWARILSASVRHGGPQFLSDEQADRIDNRLDEHHRRKMLGA
jgi:rhamnose utilization protein RhaD (predicted bifunctional aldolase and dehydrogenase)